MSQHAGPMALTQLLEDEQMFRDSVRRFAVEQIGPLVRGMHAKDGKFPTNPESLGTEVPIGQGKVDFREVLRKLQALDYHGPMTIEREIEGAQQGKDILASKAYLEKLINETYA